MNKYDIKFITPLFSCGAYRDRPEIRPASIRGQLHWWFRGLGGSSEVEREIFGSVHGKATASKVLIRVTGGPPVGGAGNWIATLPHKSAGRDPRNGPNAPRCAFPAGTAFTLIVSERLGGLRDSHRALFERPVRAWLLAGTLGLRSTRGGGSFHWSGAPRTADAFRAEFREILGSAAVRFALLDRLFTRAEDARRVITETIAHPAFHDVGYPLGAVRQGMGDPAPPRKTSPLRMTVRAFEDGFRILALWDDREPVTGNTRAQLRTAIQRLANGTDQSRPTEIGKLLLNSGLA